MSRISILVAEVGDEEGIFFYFFLLGLHANVAVIFFEKPLSFQRRLDEMQFIDWEA